GGGVERPARSRPHQPPAPRRASRLAFARLRGDPCRGGPRRRGKAVTSDAVRERMVREQIVARGVRDTRVLAAMRKIPREHFLDMPARERAYEDRPLPIGHGQTISQPYVVA